MYAVPKSVTCKLEEMMKEFLCSQQGQRRTHWVAWDKVHAPCSEGGLGIRSVNETIHGLQGKLAWKIFVGGSLWSRVLQQKYGNPGLCGTLVRQQSSSLLWRRLYPHFQNMQHNMGDGVSGRGRSHSGRRIGWEEFCIALTPQISQ